MGVLVPEQDVSCPNSVKGNHALIYSGLVTMSALPFSHDHCGANVQLSMDGLTARRSRSYDQAVVVSAAPLEHNYLYQVEVKELSVKNFTGCVRIGVTRLAQETVSGWRKWRLDNDTTGSTTTLDRSDDGQLCVCTRGESFGVRGSHIDLSSVTKGETIGVIVNSSRGITFTINGQEIRTRINPSPPRPTTTDPIFLFVDIYGPVCAVESLPVCEMRERAVLRIAGLPKELGAAGGGGGVDCEYFKLCRGFLWAQRGAIPDAYFNWDHCKCYCAECYDTDTLPRVKSKGSPAQEYTVPSGWAKFGLHVPKRAEVMDVWREWHVCYHGTPVDSVSDILDCGQLMIRGDKTLPDREPVPCPPNHFNKFFRPEGYNCEQIFLSPSLHYCTHGEVYSGSLRCMESQSGRHYTGKVAFQLRIHPRGYSVSPQTTQRSDSSIDSLIPNDRIEWSTLYRSSTILTAVCVSLAPEEIS